jgi:hypothetical protein
MPYILLHFGLLIYLLIILPQTFNQKKRSKPRFSKVIIVIEILAMILLMACFINYDISSFQDEKYFFVFGWMTLISVFGYWINKVVPNTSKILKLISVTFLGSFFWLCFFTAIKFVPYLPNSWFPLLGLYALAPIIIGILTLSEIRFRSGLSKRFNTLKIIGLGLIPLILLQIIMNFFTPYPWEFIKIFEPSNQFF